MHGNVSLHSSFISPGLFYCSNSQGNFEMTFGTFWLSIISISCNDLSLLSIVFFQQFLLKIQNHIDQDLQPLLRIQESLRGVLQKFHQLCLKIF